MEIRRETASTRCPESNPRNPIFLDDLLHKNRVVAICNDERDGRNAAGRMLQIFNNSFNVWRAMCLRGLGEFGNIESAAMIRWKVLELPHTYMQTLSQSMELHARFLLHD